MPYIPGMPIPPIPGIPIPGIPPPIPPKLKSRIRIKIYFAFVMDQNLLILYFLLIVINPHQPIFANQL